VASQVSENRRLCSAEATDVRGWCATAPAPRGCLRADLLPGCACGFASTRRAVSSAAGAWRRRAEGRRAGAARHFGARGMIRHLVDPTQYRRALATFKDLGASVRMCCSALPSPGLARGTHGETYLSRPTYQSAASRSSSASAPDAPTEGVPEKILKKLVEAEPLALGVEWTRNID